MADAISLSPSAAGAANGFKRPWLVRRIMVFIIFIRLSAAVPVVLPILQRSVGSIHISNDEDLPKSPDDASLWVYLGTAVALTLGGGVFAGLTIALMGQDEVYLQVIASSGEGSERKNAAKVLQLLKKGKHWVLVTLLLSNVITNETLPIMLDRSLGGGWPAVLTSTVLIVIFGEVLPQAVCVRWGLPIGAWMAPIVHCMMLLMSPVAWPTAKLLDKTIGEGHGTIYKKSGLKTLVTLHKSLGTNPEERLNQDEVTIITAVLDLKSKTVGSIMTPMENVFTMSTDTVLDQKTMDEILSAGYSRIPVYHPDNPTDFQGMLLVKMLIAYDPEDCLRVGDFSLATLPEVLPNASCLDIINYFQEGKAHMALVSKHPGKPYGAVGVVTLEDVIEELIGEEIIDESDVFIDVHKAIRRLTPAPRFHVPKRNFTTDSAQPSGQKLITETAAGFAPRKTSVPELGTSPKGPTYLVRRRSSGNYGASDQGPLLIRSDDPDIKQHLRHLGPSNAASKPKATRINSVKIKPGIPNTIQENTKPLKSSTITTPLNTAQGGVGKGLLESAGRPASDGVHSLAVGYGTMTSASPNAKMSKNSQNPNLNLQNRDEPVSPKSAVGDTSPEDVNKVVIDVLPKSTAADSSRRDTNKIIIDNRPSSTANNASTESANEVGSDVLPKSTADGASAGNSSKIVITNRPKPDDDSKPIKRSQSQSTIGSLHSIPSRSPSEPRKQHIARSGSITETIVDLNGIKKVVLETTSPSDSDDKTSIHQTDGANDQKTNSDVEVSAGDGVEGTDGDAKKSGKKKRRKRGKKKRGNKAPEGSESQPLLDDEGS
ncbi:DUF21-domain-containing protein [Lojkania enalia]|uniref:DUF21-domain-containing protein n=1 Tax=Lojkania enalia TaxID=147567 RepID=A0A9P4NAI1_9PLEO|nr:DUF21-domain-containing protein [Didymosphaeria enalia]